jgi:hypothetical protein
MNFITNTIISQINDLSNWSRTQIHSVGKGKVDQQKEHTFAHRHRIAQTYVRVQRQKKKSLHRGSSNVRIVKLFNEFSGIIIIIMPVARAATRYDSSACFVCKALRFGLSSSFGVSLPFVKRLQFFVRHLIRTII